jgi:uncharacterized damage-inducible protein DinB
LSDRVQTYRGLLAYTIWADRTVLESLAGLPPEDLVRETGSSFGSLLATMAHILGSEQVWLARFVGAPLECFPSEDDYADLPALAAGFLDYWPQLEVFLASLSEAQLDSSLAWTSRAGESHEAPFRHALLHFANHSTYHRGQVVAQMRQLGHPAPSTDLIYWRGKV